MIGLTPNMAKALAAIRRLSSAGVAPSFDEIQAELGLGSKSGVHRLIHDLRERGAITFRPGQARSIRVLDDLEGLERHTSEHLRAIRARIDEILRGRAS